MDIKELLRELGINLLGTYDNQGNYVIDIDDTESFGRIYSKIDSSDLLDELESSSLLTTHNSSLQYQYEDLYILNLISDFDNDTYKLVISEV